MATQYQHGFQWALATTVIIVALTGAVAAGSFTLGCAARDMQVLKIIEESENTNAASPEQLHDAMLTIMHARTVCHEGYAVDALAIYDQIAQSIAAKFLSDQRQSTKIRQDDCSFSPEK
jgi:hypothetical protein